MTADPVRRGLHAVHGATTLVLLVTGLLILFPGLRGLTLGGYGREVGELHLYLGLAFAIAPLLAWLLAPRELLMGPWRQLERHGTRSAVWRKLHIVFTLVAGAALTLSGLLLWLGADLPIWLWDAADGVHVVGHWLVTLSLPLHLALARRKIAARLRWLLGGEPPELFDLADDFEEEP